MYQQAKFSEAWANFFANATIIVSLRIDRSDQDLGLLGGERRHLTVGTIHWIWRAMGLG